MTADYGDELSFFVFGILVKKVLVGRNFGLFVLGHPRVEHGVITNWL